MKHATTKHASKARTIYETFTAAPDGRGAMKSESLRRFALVPPDCVCHSTRKMPTCKYATRRHTTCQRPSCQQRTLCSFHGECREHRMRHMRNDRAMGHAASPNGDAAMAMLPRYCTTILAPMSTQYVISRCPRLTTTLPWNSNLRESLDGTQANSWCAHGICGRMQIYSWCAKVHTGIGTCCTCHT